MKKEGEGEKKDRDEALDSSLVVAVHERQGKSQLGDSFEPPQFSSSLSLCLQGEPQHEVGAGTGVS